MKFAVLAFVCGIVLLIEVKAFTHKENTIAQFGVGSMGPGFTFMKLKSARTQVRYYRSHFKIV